MSEINLSLFVIVMATEEKPLDSSHGDSTTSSNQVHTTYVYVCKYEFLNELDMSIIKIVVLMMRAFFVLIA